MSYMLQIQAIEREALAIQCQAPFVEEGVTLPTVASAVAEFDGWLASEPKTRGAGSAQDAELAELYQLLSVKEVR